MQRWRRCFRCPMCLRPLDELQEACANRLPSTIPAHRPASRRRSSSGPPSSDPWECVSGLGNMDKPTLLTDQSVLNTKSCLPRRHAPAPPAVPPNAPVYGKRCSAPDLWEVSSVGSHSLGTSEDNAFNAASRAVSLSTGCSQAQSRASSAKTTSIGTASCHMPNPISNLARSHPVPSLHRPLPPIRAASQSSPRAPPPPAARGEESELAEAPVTPVTPGKQAVSIGHLSLQATSVIVVTGSCKLRHASHCDGTERDRVWQDYPQANVREFVPERCPDRSFKKVWDSVASLARSRHGKKRCKSVDAPVANPASEEQERRVRLRSRSVGQTACQHCQFCGRRGNAPKENAFGRASSLARKFARQLTACAHSAGGAVRQH